MTSELAKARYTEALDLHVLPDLGARYVDQIQDRDLEAWLVKPRSRKYSPRTVNGWWRVLKMCLQSAARFHRLRSIATAFDSACAEARAHGGRTGVVVLVFIDGVRPGGSYRHRRVFFTKRLWSSDFLKKS